MSSEARFIPSACTGAPIIPGDTPPLRNPQPIMITLQDGSPPKIGCPSFVDGKCSAAVGASPRPGALPLLYPNCLILPPTPTVADVQNSLAAASLSTELVPVHDAQRAFPIFADYEGGTALDIMDRAISFFPPRPMTEDVDLDALAEEITAQELTHMAVDTAMYRTTNELVTMQTTPTHTGEGTMWKLKRLAPWVNHHDTLTREERTKRLKKTKRVKGGLTEEFEFTHSYTDEGQLTDVSISSPGSSIYMKFEEDPNSHESKMTEIKFFLGMPHMGQIADRILEKHSMEDSLLARFIRCLPGEIPPDLAPSRRTLITISLKNLSISLSNFLSDGKGGETKHEQTLRYHAHRDRFIHQDNLEGTGGIPLAGFVAVMQDIFKIFPLDSNI